MTHISTKRNQVEKEKKKKNFPSIVGSHSSSHFFFPFHSLSLYILHRTQNGDKMQKHNVDSILHIPFLLKSVCFSISFFIFPYIRMLNPNAIQAHVLLALFEEKQCKNKNGKQRLLPRVNKHISISIFHPRIVLVINSMSEQRFCDQLSPFLEYIYLSVICCMQCPYEIHKYLSVLSFFL